MSTEAFIPMSRSVAFPDLEPASLRRRKGSSRVVSRSLELSSEFGQKIELIHDSAHDEQTTPSRRAEPRNEVARLTVYAMNGILMFISFPVGMAVLTFNILGGENLRTTAHAIALAGFAVALSMTELGQAIFQAL